MKTNCVDCGAETIPGEHSGRCQECWDARFIEEPPEFFDTELENEKLSVRIFLNGMLVVLDAKTINYEQVMGLIGQDPKQIFSIIYSAKLGPDIWKEGTLTPGESTDLVDGMRITAMYTGNA